MRVHVLRFVALIAATVLTSAAKPILADGGKVQLSQIVGSQRVTVFTSPTPLVVGEMDVSVLVQVGSSESIVRDEVVRVRCEHAESERSITQQASFDQSTNKLLQSAKMRLLAPGPWLICLSMNSSPQTELAIPIYVQEPSTHLSLVWFSALAPVAFVSLFLLRERIKMTKINKE